MDSKYLDNIKQYKPVNYLNSSLSIWHKLPVARRLSVFILLFFGSLGELRVVLTKRSTKLRNFPGHISFPGGKADNGLESEWQVARREMFEEIGISESNQYLKENYGFVIDHITTLPCYLSRTFSAVKPCIGFMNFDNPEISEVELIHNLKLSVNPGESSSVFSCPLKDFLYPLKEGLEDGVDAAPSALEALLRSSHRVKWGGIPWMLRSYVFLQHNQNETGWLKEMASLSTSEEESVDESGDTEDEAAKKRQSPPPPKRQKKDLSNWGRLGSRRLSDTNEKVYDVWGLTANILHDLATIVYSNPDSNKALGEEELIHSIWDKGGQMKEKSRSDQEIALIESNSVKDFGFGDILPRTEFNRLKNLYKI